MRHAVALVILLGIASCLIPISCFQGEVQSGTTYDDGTLIYEQVDGSTVTVIGHHTLPSELTIPAKVEFGGMEFAVASVSSGAFPDVSMTDLSKLTVPSETSIDDGAFGSVGFFYTSGTEMALEDVSGRTFVLSPEGFQLHARTIPGDVDMDGYVTLMDVVILRNHLTMHGTAQGAELDVNLDGSVNVADLVVLMNIVEGRA